jgi:hypothetical protein
MKSYTQLAGDSKAANRRLPWHKRHHAEVYAATLALPADEFRAYTLIVDLFHMGALHGAPNDDAWWMHALGMKSWKSWRKVRDGLIRAQMICILADRVLPVQIENGFETVSIPTPKNPTISRARASTVSLVSLAYQEEEVSKRRYPHARAGATHAHTHTPVRARDDVADDGWPGPNVVPLHGGVR